MKRTTQISYGNHLEKNANVPQGISHKHCHLNDKDSCIKSTDGSSAGDNTSSPNTDQKPPLLEIPSPDVIRKRLIQLTAAFSKTELSTFFDFSCLNNEKHNFFDHRLSACFASKPR